MTYRVDEEPMFIDSFLIEEKGSADETLIEIVGYKSRKPLEHVEADIGLEHEEGDRLLKEQADYDGAPLDVRPVLRRRPKAKLKHDQTEDGDCAVTVFRTLVFRPAPRISKRKIRHFAFIKSLNTLHFQPYYQTRSPGQ
jgi:hypothetical protein